MMPQEASGRFSLSESLEVLIYGSSDKLMQVSLVKYISCQALRLGRIMEIDQGSAILQRAH